MKSGAALLVSCAACCSWELNSPQSAAPELGCTLVASSALSLCPSLISVGCVSKQHLLAAECASCWLLAAHALLEVTNI